MVNNNPSAPPRYEATEDNNDPPPKYEEIFGERLSNEIAVEIPSQNEDRQFQVLMAQRLQGPYHLLH